MDPFERADFIRDQLRDSFACRTCGSPDPARIDTVRGTCSDCDRAEVIVEDHGAYVVVAEVAPDA